jgi:hypothetical protein
MAIIVDFTGTIVNKDGSFVNKTISYINAVPDEIYVVTGRHVSNKFDVIRELQNAGVKFERLYMNPNEYGDEDFKYSVGRDLRSVITLAIDNSGKARDKYMDLGIPTVDPEDLPDVREMWTLQHSKSRVYFN